MDKKFKTGIVIAIISMALVIIIAFSQNQKDEGTTAYTDYETDTYESDDTNADDIEDSNDETYKDEESEDENSEDYSENDVFQYQSESDELESKLKDIADEVAIGTVTSDYEVTYQYEQDDNTGYIFLTWLGASDASKSEINTMLETSGLKDSMQELANHTSEELQEVSKSTIDINGCIILRDMSNKQLYYCYNQ